MTPDECLDLLNRLTRECDVHPTQLGLSCCALFGSWGIFPAPEMREQVLDRLLQVHTQSQGPLEELISPWRPLESDPLHWACRWTMLNHRLMHPAAQEESEPFAWATLGLDSLLQRPPEPLRAQHKEFLHQIEVALHLMPAAGARLVSLAQQRYAPERVRGSDHWPLGGYGFEEAGALLSAALHMPPDSAHEHMYEFRADQALQALARPWLERFVWLHEQGRFPAAWEDFKQQTLQGVCNELVLSVYTPVQACTRLCQQACKRLAELWPENPLQAQQIWKPRVQAHASLLQAELWREAQVQQLTPQLAPLAALAEAAPTLSEPAMHAPQLRR